MPPPTYSKNILIIFTTVLLAVWLMILLLLKIDLTTADLGRHIKNGEIVLKSLSLPKTNLYSYTYGDYPTIYHHWLSGVIFYLIYKAFGFAGLSAFYLGAFVLTFIIFYRLAIKAGGTTAATAAAVLLLPLIAYRREVRPEVISYLLAGIFLLILARVSQQDPEHLRGVRTHSSDGEKKTNLLLLLPLLQILWVNSHIYFFLGPLLLIIFAAPLRVLVLTALASLLNPFGIQGALIPLFIFKNFAYRLVENQSIFFLEKLGVGHPVFFNFKIALLVLAVSLIILILVKRKSFRLSFFLLAFFSSLLALMAVRNLTLFGLLNLPVLAYFLKEGLFTLCKKLAGHYFSYIIYFVLLIFFSLSIFTTLKELSKQARNSSGLGLREGNLASVEFFKKQKLLAPIFNNYDIGGFLIFGLYPKVKVFVDNRPEAYPKDFFAKIYIPMQEDNEIWKSQLKKYQFQTIFFSYRDLTPWGQKFLLERVNDPLWAAVYADAYALIFVRRDKDAYKRLIEQYEIPKNYFKITQ